MLVLQIGVLGSKVQILEVQGLKLCSQVSQLVKSLV